MQSAQALCLQNMRVWESSERVERVESEVVFVVFSSARRAIGLAMMHVDVRKAVSNRRKVVKLKCIFGTCDIEILWFLGISIVNQTYKGEIS